MEHETPRFGFRGGDLGICHVASSAGGFGESFDPESLSVAIGERREGAELITRSEFGCVRFEEKSPEQTVNLPE